MFASAFKPALAELPAMLPQLWLRGPMDVGRAGGFEKWVVFLLMVPILESCPFTWQQQLGRVWCRERASSSFPVLRELSSDVN